MLFKFTSRGVKCYGLLCFSSSAHENRSKLDIVVGYCCLSLLFFCVREAYETNNKRNQRDFAGSLLVVHWLFSLHSFSVLAFASQTKNKNSFSPFGSTICFLRITTRPGHMRGCCRVFFLVLRVVNRFASRHLHTGRGFPINGFLLLHTRKPPGFAEHGS